MSDIPPHLDPALFSASAAASPASWTFPHGPGPSMLPLNPRPTTPTPNLTTGESLHGAAPPERRLSAGIDPAQDVAPIASSRVLPPSTPSRERTALLHADRSMGSDIGTTPGVLGESIPALDLSKYRRIAERYGLRSDQADEAVQLAASGINLISKLREHQSKTWTMSQRARDRMHTVSRLALIAPLPFSWKNEFNIFIFKLLVRDGFLPKDVENVAERKNTVVSEIGRFVSHVRSEMKVEIVNSLTPPYVNILDVAKSIVHPCAKDMEITHEVLCSLAYLRTLVAQEMTERGGTLIHEKDTWDLLDLRLNNTRKQHTDEAERSRLLDTCLQSDLNKYGAYPDAGGVCDVAKSAVSSALQATVFADARGGAASIVVAPRSRT
ncbi:hypothetical protein C8Q77DRAFT_1073625 [Trametes polyzona]|nr:hypothetical protein C8Q77DRAFT_1073625 [Trametes polyzona]